MSVHLKGKMQIFLAKRLKK
ncbi:Protein of unknown function [Bacillus cytotoxicus]|uniref:Uncharacterized protein n=1 Tax=Bacillus cytotoxicus TaxID=580165 RepID=A0AAX2CGW7_9BACI|nr:Protein of unknown function [Bacillus cytotoxicus]